MTIAWPACLPSHKPRVAVKDQHGQSDTRDQPPFVCSPIEYIALIIVTVNASENQKRCALRVAMEEIEERHPEIPRDRDVVRYCS